MAVTPTPYYGSALENLDYWGSLDGLPYSLDSDVWPNAAAVFLKGDSASPGTAVAAASLSLGPVESLSPSGAKATPGLLWYGTAGVYSSPTSSQAQGYLKGYDWITRPV